MSFVTTWSGNKSTKLSAEWPGRVYTTANHQTKPTGDRRPWVKNKVAKPEGIFADMDDRAGQIRRRILANYLGASIAPSLKTTGGREILINNFCSRDHEDRICLDTQHRKE